jgi:hypothetical protein
VNSPGAESRHLDLTASVRAMRLDTRRMPRRAQFLRLGWWTALDWTSARETRADLQSSRTGFRSIPAPAHHLVCQWLLAWFAGWSVSQKHPCKSVRDYTQITSR